MAKNRRSGRVRRLVERDGQACHYCKENTVMYSNEGNRNNPLLATADHIVPKSMGGPGYLRNFVLACRTCNERRGDNLHYCECRVCKVAINHFFMSNFGQIMGPIKPRVWKHHDGSWVTSYGLNSYSWNNWVSAMRAVPSAEKANV